MQEVLVPAFSVDRFLPYIGDERFDDFSRIATKTRQLVGERTVWNVNSTASGGGVAEMLHVLLAYARGAGFDVRWLVMEGDPEFFALTKRLHHLLHGNEPNRSAKDSDRDVYERIAKSNADAMLEVVRPDDVVILHDPQTAALAQPLADHGVLVVWRCHIGVDDRNDQTTEGWDFLRPYLESAAAFVFSRESYIPDGLPDAPTVVIHPSIDPFSAKNEDLDAATVMAILRTIDLVDLPDNGEVPRFVRQDGSPGRVDRRSTILREGGPIPEDAPVVVQVSRWDPLKDMLGVMRGFAEHLTDRPDVYLALVGPDVSGVSDDPEGAEVLAECEQEWRELPDDVRRRIHLVSLPMDDLEENAVMVNAIQRYAMIVVQKSLAEGFGLTVTEAMWKARPVVASATGGITDQIVHGEHGFLVDDPRDLEAFADALRRLLDDPEKAREMGQAARARVTDEFLSDRHLEQYFDLYQRLAS
jgi:trehalose synthase